jgi:hypothetical protein
MRSNFNIIEGESEFMPLSRFTLETTIDPQKASDAVIKALENKGYKVLENLETRITAKHSFSASYYPHEIEISLNSQSGKTIISASIDHRASQIYLNRLSQELTKTLPPLPARVFNPMERATSQEELNYQAEIVNRNFNSGEQVIWSHIVKKGIVSKEIAERWIITNMRAIKQFPVTKDNPQERFLAIGLDASDTVVMNQFRRSKGNRVGSFVGSYSGGGIVGTGTGLSSSISTSYGDLVFLHNGKEVFRFQGISDPNGINRMVKTLKKAKA